MPTANPEAGLARASAEAALQNHWPEYFMEAAALGMFMISACVFASLLEHPMSPLHQRLESVPLLRRVLMGFAMGWTAIAIIHTPWGQRSGAHMNPAITLAYLSLGKIAPRDALFYILFQFAGGIAGVLVAAMLIGLPLQHGAVNYAVTVPGSLGAGVAFLAEMVISAVMMFVVLAGSNSRRFSRYTPWFAGTLVATFIMFEAPLSGMSMNPARTLGSAANALEWTSIWIYFAAPPLAMFLAAAVFRFRRSAPQVFCAKLHHANHQRCIFHCRYGDLHAE